MDQKNKNLSEELNRMKVLGGLLKENVFDSDDVEYKEEESENNLELPQNKKNINTKLSTKKAIINALYKILQVEKVEGRYRDENWEGVLNFTQALNGVGAETDLVSSNYEGHGEIKGYESLPTRKIYKFDVSVRDKNGKVITIPFKVTCAFVGQTGTMSDEVYELTYYAIA